MIRIYESVTYRENFKISPLRKVIENLFALGKNYEDERNGLMQNLVIIIMNIFYGVQMRKDFNDFFIVNLNIKWKQNIMIM